MEYLLFREDLLEVGAEVDAYCPGCKLDTLHNVVTMFEGELRSVQCTICNSTHNYRPPRGEVEEDLPEPIAVTRRNRTKAPWREVVGKLDASKVPRYSPRDQYSDGDIIVHAKFGIGYVSELVSENKLEGTFRDGPKILVYNRADLPEPKTRKGAGAAGPSPDTLSGTISSVATLPADKPKARPARRSRSGALAKARAPVASRQAARPLPTAPQRAKKAEKVVPKAAVKRTKPLKSKAASVKSAASKSVKSAAGKSVKSAAGKTSKSAAGKTSKSAAGKTSKSAASKSVKSAAGKTSKSKTASPKARAATSKSKSSIGRSGAAARGSSARGSANKTAVAPQRKAKSQAAPSARGPKTAVGKTPAPRGGKTRTQRASSGGRRAGASSSARTASRSSSRR